MIKLYVMAGAGVALSAAGYWIADTKANAAWNEREAQYAAAQVAANEAVRAQERIWQDKITKVSNDAKITQERLRVDSAELSDVAARLRKQLADRATNSKSTNTTAADISRAAATDRVMYSVMLESVIIRAEQYAGFADQSREAALTCQAAYNALR